MNKSRRFSAFLLDYLRRIIFCTFAVFSLVLQLSHGMQMDTDMIIPCNNTLTTEGTETLHFQGDIWRTIFITLDLDINALLSLRATCKPFIQFVERPEVILPFRLHLRDPDGTLLDKTHVQRLSSWLLIYPHLDHQKLHDQHFYNMLICPYITLNCFQKLTNLTTLSLSSNNYLTDDCLMKYKSLTSLNVQYLYQITDLALCKLTNLTQLNIGTNKKITDFSISRLTKLKILNLRENLTVTNKTLIPLTNLTYLILWENPMITIQGISHLTNLTKLTLHCSRISENQALAILPHLSKNFGY